MQEKTYLAHVAQDGRLQTVHQHLVGTAALCRAFSSPWGAGDQGEWLGLLHDIGKYSQAFQKRLLNNGPRVDHATAGAYESAMRRQMMAAFCIAGHHTGLPDGGSRTDLEGATLMARLNRAKGGELEPYTPWSEEITIPHADLPAFILQDRLAAAFYTRMLYSCLVDADFLDTEAFMAEEEVLRGGGEDMPALEKKLERYIAPWFPPKGALNRQRCAILRACMEGGEGSRPGLFSLTVPTGGGKTVASLAFALKHARANGLKRIVYVIPYTSIIEQTSAVFRNILGEENVLEHHSGVLYDLGEEAQPETMRMARATENWDLPVVVTTAVQFFESLYASRSSKCRKLHNLSQSVIIFDEAQMLPISYLRPCVQAIAQLIAHYGASAVLCTATQPALAPIFAEFLPGRAAQELCPEEVFADPVFRRVTFSNAGMLDWEALSAQLAAHDQVLCIVNTRKSARRIYEILEGEGVFHLSTLMRPVDRKKTLEEIRRRLKNGETCKVVATSLIEAGVDVDFPAVFREQAGLDSILQAAGRCNREGKRPPADSVVTIFKTEGKIPPLFSANIAAGEVAMAAYQDLSGKDAVRCYFEELLDLKGAQALDGQEILPLLEKENFPFRTVAQRFHLIDNETRTVYVPDAESARLFARLESGERSRNLFRELGQYGVSVFDNHFTALESAGTLQVLEDGSALLTDPALYDARTGLALHADSGQALFG
ncbi:CRISPR-associated helicase Cas3 [uncultured Clostridium sp.]|nr:CRISPR-associated helicase Cas3 [uncultured Clostridium sp.]